MIPPLCTQELLLKVLSIEPPLTLQAFTHSVVHGVGDSDHTAKEGSPSSCHSNPLFSLNPLQDRRDKKNKRGESTIITLQFCQDSPAREWKKTPSYQQVWSFCFPAFVCIPYCSPFSTHSLYHTELRSERLACIHQCFTADDSPTPLYNFISISCKVKV